MGDSVALGSAYGSIEIGTDGATQSVNSLAASMRSAGAAMSAALTLPLVGIGVAAVNSAGDFEQSMNVMAQVSGATGDQMATLQAQALSLGATTSFSAGEAAEAMLELSKAGLEPVEVGAAIAGTMDLAAAGNLGLAQAATIAANAMNAFQLPAESVTDIANMLAAAANASSVDVTDLAQGMQMAGAVFSSNGQSVEDLTAALAILGNNAITGSDAGTSLKTMLMRLAAPTDDAAAAMTDLGLEVFNADGSMRGFGDIVGQLETATAGLTDQERSMALQTIFGSDAIRAATILAREGADGFDEMGKAIGKDGAAAATAGARMKGMNGAIEYLKGSIDSFLIGAALPFLDSMSGVVRVVADALTAFGSLPQPVMNAALAFAAVLAAAGPVLLALSGISAAIGFILSPVGLLVAGVAALAAAFTADFLGIRTAVVSTVSLLSPIFDGLYDVLIEGQEPLGDWSLWWEKMSEVVGGDAAAIISDVTKMATDIGGAVGALVRGDFAAVGANLRSLGQNFQLLWADIQAIDWGGALATVTASLTTLKDDVIAAIQSIDWAGALATAGGWLDTLKGGVISAIQGIDWAGALTSAGEWLASLRDGVVSAVTSIPWLTYLGTAGNFFAGLTQGVINRIRTINWGGLLAQAGDYLAGLWSNVVGALGRIDWGAALATATTWLTNLTARVAAAIQGIDWAGVLATAGANFAGLETAVTGALSALGFTGAATALDGIKAAFASLPAAIDSAKASFAGLWAQIAPLVATIGVFFAPAIGRLQTAFTSLPAAMAPLLPKLQALGSAFGGLVTALQPFMAIIGVGLAIAVDFGVNRLTTVFATLPGILGPIIDQVTATIQLITVVLTEVVAGVQAAIDGDWAAVWESAKAIAQGFNTFFRGLFSRLGTFMSAVAKNISQPIIDTLTDLGVDIDPILKGIQKTFETVWGGVQAAIQAVVDIVGTVTDAIGEFKDFLSGINLPNPFQPLADTWNAIQGGLSFLGGGQGGTDTGTTTDAASAGGTSYFPGGVTAINERGYEQVVLPAGSRVYTHGQTNNLPDNAGTSININLGGVTVAGDMDARRLGNVLRDQLIMAGV